MSIKPGELQSAGLELVDVVLWVAKRIEDEKSLSPELAQMFNSFAKRGGTDEVSLEGLERRWRFLVDLPEPEGPLPEGLASKLEDWESDRKKAVDSC